MKTHKMRLWEKILNIVLLIVLVIFLVVACRYYALIDITEENSINLTKRNYYYCSESNDIIIECWRKDSIVKINMRQINRDGDITFWKDINTGEEYVFYNTVKEYSENNAGILGSRPSSITTSYDNFSKFMLALTATVYIGTENYEDKECYHIKIGEQEEYVEKETGLLLNTKYGDNERKLIYSFNNVTDEDIQKPDINEYTLQENNQSLNE